MAKTALLFDTFRYTVIRRNDGSIESDRKATPTATSTRVLKSHSALTAGVSSSAVSGLCVQPAN